MDESVGQVSDDTPLFQYFRGDATEPDWVDQPVARAGAMDSTRVFDLL
jgi:hypothetical protein